jgi:hypothetical protein
MDHADAPAAENQRHNCSTVFPSMPDQLRLWTKHLRVEQQRYLT